MSNNSNLTPRGIYGGLFCFVCGTVLFIPGYANMSSSGLIDTYSSTLVYICFGLDGLLLCLAILLCIIKHNVIYIHICIGILITALSSISAILGSYWNTILTSDDYFHWDYSTSSILTYMLVGGAICAGISGLYTLYLIYSATTELKIFSSES
jgi:hypothetical protein